MSYPAFKPSDRVSRKQVAIYLDAQRHAAFRSAAERLGMPLQEALAKAVNLELQRLGEASILTAPRLRTFRRVKSVAAPRDAQPRPARRGKLALCGWYDRKEVEALSALSIRREVSVQSLGASGVELWIAQAGGSAAEATHFEQQSA